MEKFTFAQVTQIEGVVGKTNYLVGRYAAQLGISPLTLPSTVHNASDFRIKVEKVHGTLIDIAKLHASQLAIRLASETEDNAAIVVEKDHELDSILSAIVGLNGNRGLGHQTIYEIAKLTSKQPGVVTRVKKKLESKVRALSDSLVREGAIVMDIIRQTATVPQKQCMFG